MAADRAQDVRSERRGTTAEASGFAMLEVLVAIVIAAIGLLGLVGVQARALQSETEAYQRAQALVLLEDMVDLIRTNPKGAGCLDMVSGYVGTTGAGYVDPSGRCGTNAALQEGLAEWDSALKGVGESISGTGNVGAMLGARGCVNVNTSSVPNSFTVSVAWQGATTQKLPTVGASSPADVQRGIACGSGLYGDGESGGQSHRRVVWITVIPACLNC